MRRVDLSRQAAKFLRQVPPKHGRQLAAKIGQLAADPEPADGALLKGYPYRRADGGESQVIHEHDAAELRVLLVGSATTTRFTACCGGNEGEGRAVSGPSADVFATQSEPATAPNEVAT